VASLRHWQVARRAGPGSPLLDFFLSSVARDLALASAATQLAQQDLGSLPGGQGLAVRPMERRDAAGLAYREFVDRYVVPGVPVVITGLELPRWDLELLEEICGDREVPRLQYDPDGVGQDWAALRTLDRRVTLREHLRGFRESGRGAQAPMLFDHALAEVCPELLEGFVVPRYFAVDYLRAIPRFARDNIWPKPSRFPSLFVQPAGTRCGLHVDQAGTHFYQMLLSGRKRWRVFQAKDVPRLYPHGHGLLFEADSFASDDARYPLLRTAHALEAELRPGEVIFVPQGSPHQVLNEEPTIAVSANYVAGAGLDTTLAELELLAQGGTRPEYARAADALRKWAPAPEAPLLKDPGDLPWRDFDSAAWLGQPAAA